MIRYKTNSIESPSNITIGWKVRTIIKNMYKKKLSQDQINDFCENSLPPTHVTQVVSLWRRHLSYYIIKSNTFNIIWDADIKGVKVIANKI